MVEIRAERRPVGCTGQGGQQIRSRQPQAKVACCSDNSRQLTGYDRSILKRAQEGQRRAREGTEQLISSKARRPGRGRRRTSEATKVNVHRPTKQPPSFTRRQLTERSRKDCRDKRAKERTHQPSEVLRRHRVLVVRPGGLVDGCGRDGPVVDRRRRGRARREQGRAFVRHLCWLGRGRSEEGLDERTMRLSGLFGLVRANLC